MALEALLFVCDGLEQRFSTKGPLSRWVHWPMSGDTFACLYLEVGNGI